MTDDTRSYTPDLGRLTQAADDSFSVRRAYGEPYEHQGQLVIPVAKVWGGIGTGSGGGAGNGSAAGTGTGSGNGTGSGSGRGTGKSAGEGSAPGWHRSFSFGSGTADAPAETEERPGADVAAAGPGAGQGGSAHGDASGEAQGDAQGELKGELNGEARGEGQGEGGGGGGGYGLRVKPLGAIVVSAEGARFQPVLDLNRVILGGQVVGIAVALALGWAIGRRRR